MESGNDAVREPPDRIMNITTEYMPESLRAPQHVRLPMGVTIL